MDYRFKVAIQAQRDLFRIWKYIAENDAAAATAFCKRLMDVAESLKTFPQRHSSLHQRPDVRKVPCDAYIIFYKIDLESYTVEILRFWHGARDQNRLRLKEEAAVAYSAPAST